MHLILGALIAALSQCVAKTCVSYRPVLPNRPVGNCAKVESPVVSFQHTADRLLTVRLSPGNQSNANR